MSHEKIHIFIWQRIWLQQICQKWLNARTARAGYNKKKLYHCYINLVLLVLVIGIITIIIYWFVLSSWSTTSRLDWATSSLQQTDICPTTSERENFPISQILPSIDIWHLFRWLFRLISRIPGLLYGFFSLFLVFFIVFSYRFSFPFSFFCLRSLISPITICFLIFYFWLF